MKYLILNMPTSQEKLKYKLAEVVEGINNGSIKYHLPQKKHSCGLACVKCLSEKQEYDQLTPCPVVASYREGDHWVTVYFHEECFNELLGIE